MLFLKNAFWIDGKSPESFAHKFIIVKKKAEQMMHKIPFCADVNRILIIPVKYSRNEYAR